MIATLRSHSVFSEVKSSLTLFIVCFICVLSLVYLVSSVSRLPWIYCLFGLTLVLPFPTLFAPCLDYCSHFGLPLLSSPLDTVCCCSTLTVFWPCFTNKACTWIRTSHVSSASLQNTRPHENPAAFLTHPDQVWTHSISCLTCVKEVYSLRSTPLNFVCYLTRHLLMRLH